MNTVNIESSKGWKYKNICVHTLAFSMCIVAYSCGMGGHFG